MSRTNRPSFSSCSDEPVDTISNDDSITSVINAQFLTKYDWQVNVLRVAKSSKRKSRGNSIKRTY